MVRRPSTALIVAMSVTLLDPETSRDTLVNFYGRMPQFYAWLVVLMVRGVGMITPELRSSARHVRPATSSMIGYAPPEPTAP